VKFRSPLSLLATLFLPALIVVTLQAEESAYPVTPADRKFLAEVLSAVEKKDAPWIAKRTSLPVIVASGKARRVVKSRKEFQTIIAGAFSSDAIYRKMQVDAQAPLFKNWKGVMLGDGILWFGQYSETAQGPWKYSILAFGHLAFQTSVASRTSDR
jgi:hypothetical protein